MIPPPDQTPIPLSPQETQLLARFALDHADDAALWADSDGHLLYANDAACRALAYTSSELPGMTFSDVTPELTPELWSQLLKETKTRHGFALELSLRAKDHRVFPVDMTVHAMPLGQREILCAFFRDVNERKRLQQLKTEFVKLF